MTNHKNIPHMFHRRLLLLFGGGFALGDTFKSSGLSVALGEGLATRLEGAAPLLIMASVALLVTFLTEVTSNTATSSLLMPLLASAAVVMEMDPMLLMIPAAMSASCATSSDQGKAPVSDTSRSRRR